MSEKLPSPISFSLSLSLSHSLSLLLLLFLFIFSIKTKLLSSSFALYFLTVFPIASIDAQHSLFPSASSSAFLEFYTFLQYLFFFFFSFTFAFAFSLSIRREGYRFRIYEVWTKEIKKLHSLTRPRWPRRGISFVRRNETRGADDRNSLTHLARRSTIGSHFFF